MTQEELVHKLDEAVDAAEDLEAALSRWIEVSGPWLDVPVRRGLKGLRNSVTHVLPDLRQMRDLAKQETTPEVVAELAKLNDKYA